MKTESQENSGHAFRFLLRSTSAKSGMLRGGAVVESDTKHGQWCSLTEC